MPSNQTENYQLSQWAKSDQVKMEDFNADNAKIDAGLKAVDQRADSLEQTLTNHAATIAKLGNCQIYTAAYIGAENGGPVTHTFPHKPWFITVTCLEGGSLIFWRGQNEYVDNKYVTFTWEGSTVTWHCGGSAESGMNYPGRHYQIIAFLNMEE